MCRRGREVFKKKMTGGMNEVSMEGKFQEAEKYFEGDASLLDDRGNRVPCSVSCVTCRACEAVGAKFPFGVGVCCVLLLLLLLLLLRPGWRSAGVICCSFFLHFFIVQFSIVFHFFIFHFSFVFHFSCFSSIFIYFFHVVHLSAAMRLRVAAAASGRHSPNLLISHLAGLVGLPGRQQT